MTTGEVTWVAGALLAVLLISSAPGLASLRGAGPRYRRVVRRQLAFGWAAAGLVAAWLVLGWVGLNGPARWWPAYRTTTLVLTVAWGPLLFVWIRRVNRAATVARAADRVAS